MFKGSPEKDQLEGLKPVSQFLESKGRRSINTRRDYLSALLHFNRFLEPHSQTAETILQSLRDGKTNVYELLDSFLNYIIKQIRVSLKTVQLYVAAIKSYLEFHDIDIVPSKFKKKVTIPKLIREDEQVIDANDIRNLLFKCNNRRLKTYLLILGGGMRTVEALAIRIKDIDFSVRPTKIHIRGEFSKTKTARDIYVSDEATNTLKDWIGWKYKDGRPQAADDLIFQHWRLGEQRENPKSLYYHIAHEFSELRKSAGFGDRKDNSKRHKITLNSFRRFVDTTISEEAGKDYAEWFLGHSKSVYWTRKESEKRQIYATKCMKHLTFLDYTVLEAMGRSTQADLLEKDKEIQALKGQVAKIQDQAESKVRSLEDDFKSMREDMKNMLEVLWKAKQNDGRVGKDKTILDENRHITFYEDYADGQSTKTRSVSVPIDSVKIMNEVKD